MFKGLNIKDKRTSSYAGLIFVVVIWGLTPLIIKFLQNYYSPAVLSTCTAAVSACALLILCRKKLGMLNKEYIKVGGITGIFYALGEIVQKIGLPYTTPSVYAFLENLSVVVVPLLTFILIRKKPSLTKIAASLLCLFGVFVLTGGINMQGEFKFGIGEILCALSGIFYGVNIAGTGAFAKKLDSALFLMVQMFVHTIIGAITTVTLNFIKKPNGEIFEPTAFTFSHFVLLVIAVALFSSVFCWLIRTESMKHIDASVVAVIMPFSAVITGIASVVAGTDELSTALVVGGTLCLISAIISGLSDSFENKNKSKANKATCDADEKTRESDASCERLDETKDEKVNA